MDTFTKVPASDHAVKPFQLTAPPKWLRRPVGASFGFSGKLVTFNNKSISNRTLNIIHVETDPESVKRSEQLESTSKLGVEQLIEDRVQSGDKKDWEAIKTLFSENAREDLMLYLGYEKEQVMNVVQDLFYRSNDNNMKSNETSTKDVRAQNATISTLFGSSETISPDESFFGQVTAKEQTHSIDEKKIPIICRPFNLYPKESSDTDHLITRAIILGDFESAVNICLASERYSDALLFAICGGSDLLARTNKIYFEKQSKKFAYLRLLEGILEEDLSSIVRDADLSEWASVLAVLCTFAQPKDFGPLCEILGDRLTKDIETSQHATLFYLVAGNLEKVSKIWIDQFNKEDEEHGDSSTHGSRLQALIEKVTIFRQAIDYEDNALNNSEIEGNYPLSSLYDKYCEYAEFMATQGKLEIALKYISLTPAANPKSKISKGSIVRDRVYHANTSQSSRYSEPVFPFEKKQLSSKKDQQQQIHQPIVLQNPYTQSIQQRNVEPATVNYLAPTIEAPDRQPQLNSYNQQNYNNTYNTDMYNNQKTLPYLQQQQQYQQNCDPAPQQAIPLNETSAWNDPPIINNAKTSNKKKPQYANADVQPPKRVTTPFAENSPIKSDSPQQQSNISAPPPMNATPPPPMRGLWGPAAPPPPPSSSTTVGYYSAHQQPQQFQQLQQQTRATPPPFLTSSVAQLPMELSPPSNQQQQ